MALKIELWQLRQRQSLPLEIKIRMTKNRIKRWYDHWGGMVYVAFSGGKDSTVLLDIVRSVYPEVPAVFVATGMQYPEIRKFVKSVDNVTWIRPKMPFHQVIKKYGYPVVSKSQAYFISAVQNPSEDNEATRHLRLTGYAKDGRYLKDQRISTKWLHLVNAPFKISAKCCDVMKIKPIKRYIAQTGRQQIVGVMAADSRRREIQYLKYGCMSFDSNLPSCKPMAFWTHNDVLLYLKEFEFPYASVYGDIVGKDDNLRVTGVEHTGCLFCAFGVHMEREPNKFQRLVETHPKLYDYCMNKLGLAEVLEYAKIPYKPSPQLPLWEEDAT